MIVSTSKATTDSDATSGQIALKGPNYHRSDIGGGAYTSSPLYDDALENPNFKILLIETEDEENIQTFNH